MIEIKNISKKLGNTLAVNHFSMDFKEGILGIVGENGAGKSTLFRLISGIYEPDEGEILIDGNKSFSKKAKENLFFLTDDPYSPNYSTLKSMTEFYASLFDMDLERCKALIEKTGLDQKENINNFSKGMRRQAFLCVALSMKAKYLLLDEAFDGLDPLAMDWIKEEIIRKSMEDKSCILIASHNIETLNKLVDKYYVLRKGTLATTSDEQSMKNEFICLQCYFSKDVCVDDIRKLGVYVLSFKKIGAVYEISAIKQNDTKDKIVNGLNPTICEELPISPTDLIALEMEYSRRKEFINE